MEKNSSWFGVVCYVLIVGFLVQWDGLENKSTVLVYGGGAIVAVWLSSIVVGAINSVPLVNNLYMTLFNLRESVMGLNENDVCFCVCSFQKLWNLSVSGTLDGSFTDTFSSR